MTLLIDRDNEEGGRAGLDTANSLVTITAGNMRPSTQPLGTDNTTAGAEMTTTSRPAYAPGTYDYRYEFSETRKVLEEFFKAEQEFPVSAVASSAGHYGSPSQPTQQLPGQDTADLAYSLTRIEVGECCMIKQKIQEQQTLLT